MQTQTDQPIDFTLESVPIQDLKIDPDQGSPGDLISTQDSEECTAPSYERFEDVPIASIQGIPSLPDYLQKTASQHPILAKTPEGYFCLDGPSLIASARESGRESIRCYVSDLPEHSHEELALRKAAVRERAPGGEPLYAERVRNVRILFEILSKSPDVRIYRHGGDRRGNSYQEQNTVDNVISVIAERLGKSTTTINKLRSFGEHLDAPTLERLVQEKVTKDFFEKAKVNKRACLKCFEQEGKSPDEVRDLISGKMLEWLQEYKQTRNVKTVFPQMQDQGQQNEENNSSAVPETSESSQEVFDHWTGNDPEEVQVTFDSLKEEAMAICDGFKNQLADPELKLDRFCELAMDHARKLMGIVLKGRDLPDPNLSDKEDL